MIPALEAVLKEAVPLLQIYCRDPWTVIGSAAVSLAGGGVEVSDLDILTSGEDALALLSVWRYRLDTSHVHAPMEAMRFSSQFARFRFTAMPVEVMGDLHVRKGEQWQPVEVAHVKRVHTADVSVDIPTVAEQIRILELFGRPKDAGRVEILRKL